MNVSRNPGIPGQLRQNLPEIVRVLVMMAVVGTFAFEFEVTLPLGVGLAGKAVVG